MLEKFNSFDHETLATPEVKPAADAIEALGSLAGTYVATTKQAMDNPDLSDRGKEKFATQAHADFMAQCAHLEEQITAAVETQGRQVASLIQAAREADKPSELPADASFEATLAMERLKSLSPADFVAAYQAAVDGKDYITRRTAEAVSGAVLEPGTFERAQFNAIKAQVDNPSTPVIEAARRRLGALKKLQHLFGYVAEQTVRKGEVPFAG
ncbi:MAG: hypothetical protein K9K65_08875 [Desulfarculaceae bacterium]|nr:hypothetical protein [Desulfarculaceae bacterium]MCF8045904.1 hypothetical protein [Desulfarculaceae bacterium]MCF8097940.1 hypothetical protein [Desulfarculaceae bacterium]MCF8121107.1 hypothetical protein [Desulfarculaceae bacterium]